MMPSLQQTPSRINRPVTPPATASASTTPARYSSRTSSTPPYSYSSYSPTVTGNAPQKVNIVTRVAIEGKAKQGHDNASIRMYIKVSIPLENAIPGTVVPLFAEENAKITSSVIHPLDNNSVPYNFSSKSCPQLHKAARALNLPARSNQSFYQAHGLSPPSPHYKSSATTRDHLVDEYYVGQIVVSQYHIAYLLPKAFPSNQQSDYDGQSRSSSALGKRRSSIGERPHIQFVIAIDMHVPYLSQPPRAPYLLSIATPRCLHNNIKLRIFPPASVSASNASLSSTDEDGGSWDLASDPHVTRLVNKSTSRAGSYTHFADDESSDSSTIGFSHDFGIQGTFPSTERIRVRWAKPLKTIDFPSGGDGRRRVGVRESKGEMTCVVRGKVKDPNGVDGVLMNVEYTGKCRGVWFGGVATQLGMDVGLEAKNSEVTWVPGFPSGWVVTGGKGYTGFDVGTPRSSTLSRHNSMDSASMTPSRHDSTSSTSSTNSLLRAPLPNQNVAEYSFESSTSSTSSQLQTSSSSLPASNFVQAPGHVMTMHLNMNELLPPSNTVEFSVSGTILVTPRLAISKQNGAAQTDLDFEEPIVIPRFTVLAADSENCSITIKNEIEDSISNIEIYPAGSDSRRDGSSRKSILQRAAQARCEPGARIAIRSLVTPTTPNGMLQPATRSRTSSTTSRPSPVMNKQKLPGRPKDGPVMVPSVTAIITPLVSDIGFRPDAYAVRLKFSTGGFDSDWVEFGLAKPGPMSSSVVSLKDSLVNSGRPPKIDIVGASVQGVPVRVETSAVAKTEPGSDVPFEEMSGKEWWSWIKVHTGHNPGEVIIDYVVKDDGSTPKGKAKARDELTLNVFLPAFPIPIGRLEVMVESFGGLEIATLESNLSHQRPLATGRQLLQYSVQELFYPYLSLTLRPTRWKNAPSSNFSKYLLSLTLIATLVALAILHQIRTEIQQTNRALSIYSVDANWPDEPLTITSTGPKWWFSSDAKSSSDISAPPLITAPSLTTPASSSSSSLLSVPSRPSYHESLAASFALIPATLNNFSWDDLGPMRKLAAIAYDKLTDVFDAVWRVCRRVYHFPLEPA